MISSLADAVLKSASKTLGVTVTETVLDDMLMAQHVLDISEARYDVHCVAHPSPPGRGYGHDGVSAVP